MASELEMESDKICKINVVSGKVSLTVELLDLASYQSGKEPQCPRSHYRTAEMSVNSQIPIDLS